MTEVVCSLEHRYKLDDIWRYMSGASMNDELVKVIETLDQRADAVSRPVIDFRKYL